MFYVKTQLTGGVSVKTEITDENVFCRCPDCGSEVSVDLAEVFNDGEGDLFGTAVLCCECTKLRMAGEDDCVPCSRGGTQ